MFSEDADSVDECKVSDELVQKQSKVNQAAAGENLSLTHISYRENRARCDRAAAELLAEW
jgi:hypothetical protein